LTEDRTYEAAGVSLATAESVVDRLRSAVESTGATGFGHFAGLYPLDSDRYLAASTDGVGSKLMLQRRAGKLRWGGMDLAAHCINDVACSGAEPLFFLDYVSVGKLVPEHIDQIVAGVAHGCREAGCALLGGEMSEHPGVMEPGEFDLVGFAVGVIERSAVLPRDVRAGDRLIGMASPGLRCNGYSLARAALLDRAGRDLHDAAWPGAHTTLGEVLLVPSVIYAPAMLELASKVPVRAYAHITGGGLPGNIARVLPERCDAVVTRVWEEPRIFAEIQRAGDVADAEMEHVFNLGIGMVAVVPAVAVQTALDTIRASGHDAWAIGEVVDGHGRVTVRR